MIPDEIYNILFSNLSALSSHHNRDDEVYLFMEKINDKCVENLFFPSTKQEVNLDPFGLIKMPFHSMGAINSSHLFGLDELIIFSFYANNIGHYRHVIDIGANIGLHSIMLAKLGYDVTCFEPDPITYEKLLSNLSINEVDSKVKAVQRAVSTKPGVVEFTRVLGNTTGSHISGAKKNPYGDLERFEVETEEFRSLMQSAGLLKIDVEGHEGVLLCSTSSADWSQVDAMVEIGNEENALNIFKHFQEINVNLFAQKTNWRRVSSFEEMPISYKEGSIFISAKKIMQWG